ncbi:hypothetical protein BC938DRAFT_471803, partial [Jimgerdemannia flammicorona]
MPGRAVEYQGHGPHLYRQCGREGRYSHPGPAQPRPRDPSPVPGLRSHLKALALEERRDFRSHKPRQARPGPKEIQHRRRRRCLPNKLAPAAPLRLGPHPLPLSRPRTTTRRRDPKGQEGRQAQTSKSALLARTLPGLLARHRRWYVIPFPPYLVFRVCARIDTIHLPNLRTSSTESLFDNSASHERKYWGFQIVERVLPLLPSDQTPFIFTANFMRCFINNLSSEDRFLNKAARHT